MKKRHWLWTIINISIVIDAFFALFDRKDDLFDYIRCVLAGLLLLIYGIGWIQREIEIRKKSKKSKKREKNKNRKKNNDMTIKHEYGHVLQGREYGILKHLCIIFIPSTTYNVASRFSMPLSSLYYSMPWEYDAEIRGGNNRTYASWASLLRDVYFALVGES